MDEVLIILIKKLQRIAKLNRDEFKYSIDIIPQRDGTVTHEFMCCEKADGHTFVAGTGPTTEQAARAALDGVANACIEWAYKCPEDPDEKKG